MIVTVADNGPAVAEVEGPRTLPQARQWLRDHRAKIRSALDEHGALMLRGLPVSNKDDFGAMRDELFDERVAYREKATPRSDFGDDVFSSTDFPPEEVIRLHNENSYTIDFPGQLLFSCLVAPETGGATTVADSRRVLAELPPELVARFREQGWQLRRHFHPHVSLPWRTAFGVDTREEVEEYCRRNLIACSWGEDDSLYTSQLRPATVYHPETGDESWFNHVAFWNEYTLDADIREVLIDSFGRDGLPFQTRYGDGEPIDREDVERINAAYDRATRRESWRPGDLLLVDNVLSCHGREAFTGRRRIVVAMGQARSLSECRPTVTAAPGTLSA